MTAPRPECPDCGARHHPCRWCGTNKHCIKKGGCLDTDIKTKVEIDFNWLITFVTTGYRPEIDGPPGTVPPLPPLPT